MEKVHFTTLAEFVLQAVAEQELRMDDRKTPMSEDTRDSTGIWMGGLAALFLVLGFFAILWGGHSPAGSASSARDIPVTSGNPGLPVNQRSAPSTSGQRAR